MPRRASFVNLTILLCWIAPVAPCSSERTRSVGNHKREAHSDAIFDSFSSSLIWLTCGTWPEVNTLLNVVVTYLHVTCYALLSLGYLDGRCGFSYLDNSWYLVPPLSFYSVLHPSVRCYGRPRLSSLGLYWNLGYPCDFELTNGSSINDRCRVEDIELLNWLVERMDLSGSEFCSVLLLTNTYIWVYVTVIMLKCTLMNT